MIDLHPEFLEKNGKKEFVILTYEEFSKVKEVLEDFEDLVELRKIKSEEADKEPVSIETVKKEFNIISKSKKNKK
jgi:hypothetical protein